MDFSSTCRTCLSNKELNPIFVNPGDYKRYSSALIIVAGIKVEVNDGLPQNMCTDCINMLNNSLRFRKQCKDVEAQLLELKNQILIRIESENDDESSIIIKNSSILKIDERISTELEDDGDICESNDGKHDDNIMSNNLFDDTTEDKIKYSQNVDEIINESDREMFLEESLLESKPQKLKGIKSKSEKGCTNKEPPYQVTFSGDGKTQRVTCKMCQKDLSIRSIATHMARLHPGADERRRKCELCDEHVLAHKMGRHVGTMHGRDHRRCGYCKTEFDSRETLVDHVTNCTAKKKKRKASETSRQLQECDVCHKLMQRASLRAHKDVAHAGLGPVCEHCGKKFGNKFRLNEHYRAKHGYEKFRCSYCDFQSAGIMSMRNHERRHRGEKPFACEACGAKFHAAYLLAQHKQSHRTEKLVKCERCPARFKARNSLHAHRLARHARAAFACAVCARVYAARHYALRHARHAHRGATDKPLVVCC